MTGNNICMKTLIKNFLTCGLTGWCLEILFTALNSLRRRDFKLMGKTSIWMFPIYGCAAFLLPVFNLLRNTSLRVRGSIYALCIFIGEFFSGRFLSKWGLCPWDYSHAKWNIKTVIRLDYFPGWFLAGLLFEKLLTRKTPSTHKSFLSPRQHVPGQS